MSDLREALEKLADELEYDVAGAPGKIRALLAAYPAEPGLPTREQGAAQEATGNCFSCMAPHSKRFPCIWGV